MLFYSNVAVLDLIKALLRDSCRSSILPLIACHIACHEADCFLFSFSRRFRGSTAIWSVRTAMSQTAMSQTAMSQTAMSYSSIGYSQRPCVGVAQTPCQSASSAMTAVAPRVVCEPVTGYRTVMESTFVTASRQAALRPSDPHAAATLW